MKAKCKIITAMLTWGSMGVIVRHINLPAGRIALIRAVIGLLFLIVISLVMKKAFPKKELVENKWILVASGIVLGVNWIFIFEAYKHTTIAIATLSYYLAPIIIVIMSTIIFKEKLTFLKGVLMITALVGLALVSGVIGQAPMATGNGIGILLGIAAAIAYASFTIMNKSIKGLSSMDSTIAQFGISALVLIPYTLLKENSSAIHINLVTVLLLMILGILHTGLAFWLFFSAIRDLKAQTIAVFSYLDPVTAVLLSALILNEKLGVYQVMGACIILISAFISGNMEEIKKLNKNQVILMKLQGIKNQELKKQKMKLQDL